MFIDNIWVANLAEMGSLSGAKYLLCVMDVFNKYVRVRPLKDKKLKQFFVVLLK